MDVLITIHADNIMKKFYYTIISQFFWLSGIYNVTIVSSTSVNTIDNVILKENITVISEGVLLGLSYYNNSDNRSIRPLPPWVYEFDSMRKKLFMKWVEPIIVWILGPVLEEEQHLAVAVAVPEDHRRLGFLPSYVEDVTMFRESSMSFATLTMLFIIMSCLMVVFLSCFYHNQKTSPLFISPRRHRLPNLVPPPLPVDRTLSWVQVCLCMSDEEIITRVGYDALIFIRFHRLALRCIVKMSVFSFLVLLPLNFTGGGHANASDLKGYVGTLLFTDFLRFTMANVSGGSPRLLVHCFSAYLLTAIVCRELLVEYNAFNSIRHRYMLSREPHLRTVLVSNIPRHLRTSKKISTYFRNIYPDAVKSITLCQNLIRLERLVIFRTSILAEIERELLVLCRYEKRKLVGRSKLHQCRDFFSLWNITELLPCFHSAQERITNLYTKLELLNNQVEKEQLRRRTVMKRLDKLEACKGSKDIDYLLASPFLGNHPEQVRTMGLRISDSTSLDQNYQPPTIDNNVNNANNDHSDELRKPSGPFLRPSTNGNKEEHATSNQRNKRPFGKAKQAIQRYAKFTKRSNLLGKATTSSSPRSKPQVVIPGNNQLNIENHTNEVTDKAFVVMRTFTASTIAIQSMHSAMPGSMQVTTAPEPRDILWDNMYLSKGAKRTRSYIAELIVLLLIAFYIVPVALVSLLVSESALISSSPRLAQLDQASALFSSIIALVQPMCIVGLQQLLPPIFIAIGKAEGYVSFSEVQLHAFSRYFLFQVINVFLVTAIAGSIFDTLAVIVENPETAFEMLGNALPRMSSFFITLVIMKSFLGLGIELVRTMSIIQACLRYLLFPMSTLRSQRSVRMGLRSIDDPGFFPFHKILAQDMLVVVISVVFA